MKKKLITVFIIIAILAILAAIIPSNVFAKMDTDISLGGSSDLHSSDSMIKRMLGTVQVAGSAISIIALIIIGMRYMLSSLEEKASMKGILIYYVIGAILVFATSNVLGFAYTLISSI